MNTDAATITSPHADQGAGWLEWSILGVVLALVLFVRWRTLDVPLERDEGEYAYIGQLMLRGVPPYADAYTMKYPGTPAVYALAFLVWGESVRTIHLALLLANLANTSLVVLLAARFYDRRTAVASGCLYALWTLTPKLQGLWAHAENFALLFALAGCACLLSRRNGAVRLLTSGILFGIAVTMKQHAALFVAPSYLYFAIQSWRSLDRPRWGVARQLGLMLLGTAIPLASMVAALWWCGVLSDFWYWTFRYARHYAAGSHDFSAPAGFILRVAVLRFGIASYLLDGLMLFGAASLAWSRANRSGAFFWGILWLAGLAAAAPGLRFAPHHFTFLLPAASVFAALGAVALAQLGASMGSALSVRRWQLGITLATIALVTYGQRVPWFQWTLPELSWMTYGLSAFPQSEIVGRYLQEHAESTARVAVLGSEPEIYFYSGLRGASRFLYVYPFAEAHPFAREMEEEMIQQIERADPEYCVLVRSIYSWGVGDPETLELPLRDVGLLRWWNRYNHSGRYEQVGLVTALAGGQSLAVWGAEARTAEPKSGIWLAVYRRK